jgi:23S rRNA-/tRNA-specific pseudouridylate synthase
MTSVRYSQAWINTEIRRLSRRKQNAYNKAKAKLNTEPSTGASHQISVHFGIAVSEKKIFRN